MKKKLVTIHSLDKALAYIKETSGSHSDMFIRDTAQLLEWYGVKWEESGEKPESIMTILDEETYTETDDNFESEERIEAREIVNEIAEDTMQWPDYFAIWIARSLQRHYHKCIKTKDSEPLSM